jgi:uncharacterized membrane protein
MLALHTTAGLLALLTGVLVAVLPKGTALHRNIGWSYGGSMYMLCLSSLFVPADIIPFFDIGGITYGIFHVFAVWGTLQLSVGLLMMVWHKRFTEPVKWHLYHMQWSFVGLIMATNSHFFRYAVPLTADLLSVSPSWAFGVMGLLLWGVPVVVGTVVIERAKSRYILC